jgi:hypothetical protein
MRCGERVFGIGELKDELDAAGLMPACVWHMSLNCGVRLTLRDGYRDWRLV